MSFCRHYRDLRTGSWPPFATTQATQERRRTSRSKTWFLRERRLGTPNIYSDCRPIEGLGRGVDSVRKMEINLFQIFNDPVSRWIDWGLR